MGAGQRVLIEVPAGAVKTSAQRQACGQRGAAGHGVDRLAAVINARQIRMIWVGVGTGVNDAADSDDPDED